MSPFAKTPHLASALVALVLIALVLLGGEAYAQQIETNYIHALAPLQFDQKLQGIALPHAALREPDLLPFYGSSEFVVPQYPGIYRPGDVFRNYPTGFTVFSMGSVGRTSLIYLESLAALGTELRGKKVAISISPPWFFRFENEARNHQYYAGNFSRLHAGELAFSLALSFELKQRVARQMLEYPETLDKDPVLKFALEQLADGSLISRALYYLALPAGKILNFGMRLQDHAEVLGFIGSRPNMKSPPRLLAPVDWPKLQAGARLSTERATANNPIGYDAKAWGEISSSIRDPDPALASDDTFVRYVSDAPEWTNLELLLRELKELGAQPLILSQPIKGNYYDLVGISARARTEYYDKLEAVARAYDVSLFDFRDHDRDKYFDTDRFSHLSPIGWIYYDQALDSFYHAPLR